MILGRVLWQRDEQANRRLHTIEWEIFYYVYPRCILIINKTVKIEI